MMPEALAKNEGYKAGTKNRFIFPDEEAYRRHIHEIIAVPIVQKIELTGPDGKPYSFGQESHP